MAGLAAGSRATGDAAERGDVTIASGGEATFDVIAVVIAAAYSRWRPNPLGMRRIRSQPARRSQNASHPTVYCDIVGE